LQAPAPRGGPVAEYYRPAALRSIFLDRRPARYVGLLSPREPLATARAPATSRGAVQTPFSRGDMSKLVLQEVTRQRTRRLKPIRALILAPRPNRLLPRGPQYLVGTG